MYLALNLINLGRTERAFLNIVNIRMIGIYYIPKKLNNTISIPRVIDDRWCKVEKNVYIPPRPVKLEARAG